MQLKRSIIYLAICLSCGTALRFVGLTRGGSDFVPRGQSASTAFYHFNPDEETVLWAALEPLSPLMPELTSYGALPIYILRGWLIVTSWVHGEPLVLDDPDSAYAIYVSARFLAGLISCACIVLTWLLGRRLFGEEAACLGTGFVTFSPGAIQQAHFVVIDSFFGLCSLVALLTIVAAFTVQQWRLYVLAGCAIGATAAVRLNGMLLVVVLAAGVLFEYRWGEPKHPLWVHLRHVAVAAAAALVTLFVLQPFLIGNPSLLLRFQDSNDFAMSLQFARGQILQPWTLIDFHSIPYWDHWFRLWPLIAGWPLTLAFTVGIVCCLKDRKVVTGIVILWAGLYFLSVASMQVKAVRHLVSVLPLFSLFAAHTCITLIRHGSSIVSRRAAVVGTVAVVVFTTMYGISFAGIYTVEDSRIQAARWLNNLPRDLAVGVEGGGYSLANLVSRTAYRPLQATYLFYVGPYSSCGVRVSFLRARLQSMDYITLVDVNRYEQFLAVPDLFPMVADFYEKLMAGELGFERVHTFGAKPELGGIGLEPDIVEPSFKGYDHPIVWILKKVSNERVDSAFLEWAETLQVDSRCPDGSMRAASKFLASGSYDSAIRVLTMFTESQPNSLLPYLLLAEASQKAGHEADAHSALSKLDPFNAPPHLAHVSHAGSVYHIPSVAALSLVLFGEYDLAVSFLKLGRDEFVPATSAIAAAMASSYEKVASELTHRGHPLRSRQVMGIANKIRADSRP